jgi:protocatechuate 3,4-dioxygenase alpha subunit
MNGPLQPTPEIAPGSASPGHTIGPFFHGALGWAGTGGSADDPAHGPIRIEGTVEDGAGERLPAWLVEAWVPQAVAAERAAGLAAPGFRRLLDDDKGEFSFRVHPPAAGQPAAFVTLFGVGLTRHQFTAVFLDAASADGSGGAGLLDAVPAERRATLIAERIGEARYRWTIRTQGERETVFFDYR